MRRRASSSSSSSTCAQPNFKLLRVDSAAVETDFSSFFPCVLLSVCWILTCFITDLKKERHVHVCSLERIPEIAEKMKTRAMKRFADASRRLITAPLCGKPPGVRPLGRSSPAATVGILSPWLRRRCFAEPGPPEDRVRSDLTSVLTGLSPEPERRNRGSALKPDSSPRLISAAELRR